MAMRKRRENKSKSKRKVSGRRKEMKLRAPPNSPVCLKKTSKRKAKRRRRSKRKRKKKRKMKARGGRLEMNSSGPLLWQWTHTGGT
jgi:hypothetical protein